MDEKKQTIIACSLGYLNQYGVHATSVEQLAMAAGITKRTLYNHFACKDDLIAATVSEYSHKWLAQLQNFLESSPPQNALLAYIDFLTHWLQQTDFHGCYCINICAEYSDHNHFLHQAAVRHKQCIQDALEHRLPMIHVLKHPAVISVMTMAEGLMATQQIHGQAAAALTATRQLAHYWTDQLLDTL